jgi:hypothetical protein
MHGNFTDSFSVSVVERDKVNWLVADLTACSVSANCNIISYNIPHFNPPPLAATSHVAEWLLNSTVNQAVLRAHSNTKRTPVTVAVHSYGINYLIWLNKFSPQPAVRYTIYSWVTETFCTELCIVSTVIMWNNINIIREISSLPEGLNKFSYVVLPEHVNTRATSSRSIF